MMKEMKRYIASIFSILALSCAKQSPSIQAPQTSVPASTRIDASCSVIQHAGDASSGSGIATRAIIGQTTVGRMEANFIKLDESRNESWTSDLYEATSLSSWAVPQTRILDADILSSPDITEGIHFRSVVFNPRQTYQIHTYDKDGNPATTTDTVTVGYISRMVGWYPKTFDLPLDEDGIPADTQFTETGSYEKVTDPDDGKEYDCVVFKDMLDGQTDIMMTDMREGRYDLRSFGYGFMNNGSGKDYDIQPYGHQFANRMDPSEGYEYCNYFTFKHYLCGIRLFVKADDSNLNLIGYKQIDDVVFADQPATVKIALPTEQSRTDEISGIITGGYEVHKTLPVEGVTPMFGKALAWEGRRSIPIIKTAMAENDPDHAEFSDVPEYPVIMENAVDMDRTYLGYMLVQPDTDTRIEIHTDAGVFAATIPVRAKNQDGTEEDILRAGYIYNIIIDIKANGSLDVIIGNEDDGKFRDLAPHNDAVNGFEYANCYVVTPEKMKIDGTSEWYDGFYFYGGVAGRGELGTFSVAGAELYPDNVYFEPRSARILWQDKPYLIRHVELIHGYVRFTLNEECKNGLTGNAVLAVYDEAGEILWTWHIWVTDSLEDISYNNIFYNSRYRSFSMMNMNLGATRAAWTAADNVSDVLECYGLYYQWGRKDPSPGPAKYDYAQADMSTMSYYYMDEGERTSVSEYLEASPTVETGAKHPLDIIRPTQLSESYPNDWLYSQVDQLWGYSPSSGKVAMKTIYDPCPYGYRVPDDELEVLFSVCRAAMPGARYSEITYDGDGMGINVTMGNAANFFPYTGWRGHDRGRTDKTHAWFYVGALADYQDARVNKDQDNQEYYDHRGRSMLIQNSLFTGGSFTIQDAGTYNQQLTTDYANRTSAAPVRCIRYDAEP